MNKEEVIKYLSTVVGEQSVVSEEAVLKDWGSSWTKVYKSDPLVAVIPKSTKEVSDILKFCNKESLSVVPSGGRTGLAGGAIAENKEVILSLDKMNKILKLDLTSLNIEVEAGIITQRVQEEAARNQLFFPIDLAAKGSSQIGGNIATNAGGLKFIAYGGMREQVLGIEVVLADGEILNLNSSLRKNNTGYDLKHIFVGSEGTLGIITKATLKLTTKPKDLKVACVGLQDVNNLLDFLKFVYQQNCRLTAFEFFSEHALAKVQQAFPQTMSVFQQSYPIYAVMEIEIDNDEEALENILEKSFENGLIEDALVSTSSRDFQEIWGLRENISESLAAYGHVRKNDVSVTVSQLALFLNEIDQLIKQSNLQIEIITFGHAGDGNVHINYVAPSETPIEIFEQQAVKIEEKIFLLLSKYKGSISAEHGVGLLKKKDLGLTRSALEIDYMRQIKKVFDPKGILNPGKIF